MHTSTQYEKRERGFAHLVGIVLVSAVGMSIAITILLFSTTGIHAQDAERSLAQTRGSAESCAEIALLSLKNDMLYSGTEEYHNGNTHCTGTTTNSATPGGRAFVIDSTGTLGSYARTIHITGSISTGTPPTMETWEEL